MNYTKISNDGLLNWLKTNLTEKRFQHSIATAETARELGIKFGLDSEKLYVAGLLHDCAKCFSNEKLKEIIDNYLDIEESEIISYKTWHAPVSAYIAQKEFGVEDEEILSSIRWHTIGKMNMTDFEKIVFLADKIEPKTREQSYIDLIAPYIKEKDGLNKALLASYKETIMSLVKRDLKICFATIEIYNKLEERLNVN